MRASSISVSSLPQALQDELSNPFSKKSSVQDERSELRNAISRNIPNYENDDMIIIVNNNPIFKQNDSSEQRPHFLTRTENNCKIDSKPEDDIFVLIDYSNFDDNFSDLDEVQKHLNVWADYTHERLKKLTEHAPRVIIHVFQPSDCYSVLDIYNDLYHPNKRGYAAGFAEAVKPRVIIECGEHLNYSIKKSDNQIDYPHFHLLYSIVDSANFPERIGEIKELIHNIGNGFAVVHDSKPNIDIAAKILELTCIIAARFTYSFSEENLVESLTKGTFLSSKRILDSKSSSISSTAEYSEIPIISPHVISKLSSNWDRFGKSSFIENLKNFDKNIAEFRYNCNTGIRNDLEIFDYRLFHYGLMPHMLDYVTDGNNHALTRSEILKEKETLWDRLESQPDIIDVKDLLGYNKEYNLSKSDVKQLLKILIDLNDKQYPSYSATSKLNHSNAENKSLMILEEYGVRTTLVDHFDSYRHLKDLLSEISDEIENLKANGFENIAEIICKFYGIAPLNFNGGEQNE